MRMVLVKDLKAGLPQMSMLLKLWFTNVDIRIYGFFLMLDSEFHDEALIFRSSAP